MGNRSFNKKIRAIVLSLMAFLAISLPSFASADFCSDLASTKVGSTIGISCGTATTSFTQFSGSLSVPNASQYAAGLNANQDLRTYIKNVVNFALGFLGLIAVVVIIYGGFMYVTAAGKEEQAGKGKKAVTYAIIGILIILGSFAIVNTVLQAGGSSATNGAASGTSADQNAKQQSLFNYAAGIVQTVASDFVTAYQNYTEVNTAIGQITTEDVTKLNFASDVRSYLTALNNSFTNIAVKAGALGQVAEKTKNAIAALQEYQTSMPNLLAGPTEWTAFWTPAEQTKLTTLIDNYVKTTDPTKSISAGNDQDFALAIKKASDTLYGLQHQINRATSTQAVTAAFTTVLGDLAGLTTPPLADPGNTTLFPNGVPVVLVPFSQITKFFINIAFAADALTLAAPVDNTPVLKIVTDLSALYDIVKNLQFVYTVINADQTHGNAPLPVNFDGLKSLDPNNHTIPDANYCWDFGDGSSTPSASPGSTPCDATVPPGMVITGVTPPTHVYAAPGTYIVELYIKGATADASKGENQPADGVAHATITVKPPVAEINMTATAPGLNSGTPFPLSTYGSNGLQTVNVPEIQVTTSEAKAGITFDVTGTYLGGNSTTGKKLTNVPTAKIKWDFGDKSNPNNTIEGLGPDSTANNPTVKYQKDGTYLVTFEVTDDHGISDFKFFNIVVSSLAARIQTTPAQAGLLGDQFQFQSVSASDAGPITAYDWTLSNSDTASTPADFTAPSTSADSFKYTFTEPGHYKVGLTADNGSPKTASTSSDVVITSKPPVAQYTFTNSDPTHPNRYAFDGSSSYDPDGTPDELMSYKWEVNAAPGDCGYYLPKTTGGFDETVKTGNDCAKDLNNTPTKGYSGTNNHIEMKFKKGKYTITLDVVDATHKEDGISKEQDITVDNDLDVGWSGDGKPLVYQLNNGSVNVPFDVTSDNGVAYQIDTGDGGKETGTITKGVPTPTPSGTTPTTIPTHTYTQAGAYEAKLTVFDAQDNGNATYRKVFIGAAGSPIAAASLSEDGQDILDTKDPVIGNRTSVFIFDAGKSINVDGTGRNLNYSWDFGDGSLPSSKKTATHTYTEIGDKDSKDFPIKLTVTNVDDATKSATDTSVKITIKRLPPVISGLTAVPATKSLTTPVQVNVAAVGANDPDGKITSYKWWYYDVNDPATQLGVQITQNANTTLTIGTNGAEGEKHTYQFGVIATDNENLKFDSSQSLAASQIPSIDVVNGPNKAPTAKFNVDRTSINVGESVNFSSSSTDQDGKIMDYMWNFENQNYTDPGDKQNDKANVTYTYTKAYKNGVKVRLKVRDNNGAEAVSDPVTIYVDSKAAAPTAAFTSTQLDGKKIQFTSNATADTANGANIKSYAWDFDVNTDANGDGIKDNDVQSTDANPTFEYPDYGIYRAKLTVTDDQGSSGSVSNFVNVKAPAAAAGTTTPAVPLQAKLTSTPATSVADGKIHLQGDTANVTFDFSGSTGNIVSYIIDKNTNYDSDGDGNPANDADYKTDKPGTWTTPFLRSYGAITVRLTVTDATGKKSTVDKSIVFDAPPAALAGGKTAFSGSPNGVAGSNNKTGNEMGAFVLAGYEVVDWQVLLVSLLGFGIFIISTLNKKKNAPNK